MGGASSQFEQTAEEYRKQIAELWRETEIYHEETAPNTPEQKGVAERANRTICERIRAILAETGVPKEFWTETAPPSQELQPNVSPQGNEAVLSSIPQEARHLSPCCNRHKKVRSYSEKEDQEIGSSQFGRTE